MNAPRRLATLPLPACLLRTPRRLTSSQSSPSGKSLPSSPLVLTTSRRIAPKLLLLLIGLATLLALLPTSSSVQAQTPANQSATGRPVVLASAQGAGILFADTEAIADGNGLPIDTSNTYVIFNWTYQWIRVDGNSETNVGADSASYQTVEADVGNKIKVRVSFTDGNNYSEARTSLPFGPIVEPDPLPASTLVSNTGQSASSANITQQYALGFRLGDHGQGYEISSVSIDLAAAPSNLTVSLWSGGVEGGFQANTATKLFDFVDPSSFTVGLNKFTAPAGAFAYQNVNYFVVLSGFGSSLSINQTTSNNEDAGGETGAVIYDDAAVRASATGKWSISDDRANVLRMAVEGSRRARGILASSYAQNSIDDKGTEDTSDDTGPSQEIISVGDKIGLGGIELGAADRYLIRGVSFSMDDTTPSGSGFTNPLDLRSGSRTGSKQFSLTNSRKASGLPVWTAPQGATVTGGNTYAFDMPVGEDGGPENTRRRDATLTRLRGPAIDGVDDPAAEGVSITGTEGDVAGIDPPYIAVHGEPLDAMVQNLGQTNNSHVSAGSTNKVVSQGFTTGSDTFGYRVQGIGVNIEGSGSNYPDGPTSVSVAVHEDSSGRPGRKLFDLVSPDEFGAGHSFFEAPPGTHLAPDTSYVLVWSHVTGTTHRLQKTASNSEDSGKATGSSIENAYYRGADLGSLSEDSGGNAVEIAVYTETNTKRKKFAEVPVEPTEPPFEPGITGGGTGHFRGDAILRCSVPPDEHCPTYDHFASGEPTTFLSTTMTVGDLTTTPDPITTRHRVGYFPEAGNLGSSQFTYGEASYSIGSLFINRLIHNNVETANVVVLQIEPQFPSTFHPKLALELDGKIFLLSDAGRELVNNILLWSNHGLTWTENESVAVRLFTPPDPNAYGYRTIWTALMTADTIGSTAFVGYNRATASHAGDLTNNLIVTGRDETVTIGTPGQPRYPWIGYEIEQISDITTQTQISFDRNAYPSADEVAGWTLTLGGGVELPFADAQLAHATTPWVWQFTHAPGWSAGDQVLVSIRNDEVQNRVGQTAGEEERAGEVKFKSRRSTSVSGGNIVYGKTHFSYDHEPDKFGPADGWELRSLTVTTDKTGDTDPVWIRATFRASGSGAAGRAWQGYWEGQFDDFHTLFLRWIYNEGGIGKGEATYTLPLRSANGIWLSNFGRDVTFTWVRTYKEFERRHLDLANHSAMSAHMLASPQPATARAGGEEGDGDNLQRQYVPTTVTSVDFTSNPGSDRVYGLGDTIQVTVAFSEDVTVVYDGSKKHAAEVDLEMGDQTRTAHYARTDGNRVIFEYTVVPGDEEPFALLLPPNSLRLDIRDRGSKNWKRHSWIRDSEGRDAVLDHNGLGSTAHRVDAVSPEFASAQVSSDGAQVAVTFNESIRSPARLRAWGVQTSLLQSLALDVLVDGELAARSGAAVSGDTITLTMAEPVTQGQTVAVSHDNLFVQTGETILQDLRENKLLPFTEQPATNGSTLADVERPDGGLALSRTDLKIDEGQSGTYTVALASQPASDVTVEISQRPTGRATVSPASLTFTADNWNTPQTVTITSTEDANYVDRWVLLRHVATGDDYGASAAAWLILRDTYNVGTTPANNRATGRPTIDGTSQVGQTLTVDTSGISDADGLTHASYTWLYQWLRGRSEIRGATDSTYTLGLADEGKTIKVKVSFTDDAHNQESRTSAPTVAVAPPPNTLATGEPTISGTPQVRRTLTVDASAIEDADGLENAVFRYQWFATKSSTTREIAGETSSTYKPVPADEGHTFHVEVSFTDDRGYSETRTSAATEVVVAVAPNSEPTGLPAVNGTPQVGETLTADTSAIDDPDGLENVSYRYQWISSQAVIDDVTGTSNILSIEIPGETGQTYTLIPDDEGSTFQVKVSFTDDADYEQTLTSEATVAVAPPPNTEPTGLPAVTGTPQVGETLAADTSAIDDADGLTNATFEYQWLHNQSVVDANTGTSYYINVEMPGETGSTYTLAPADKGRTFAVRVSFTDDRGHSESLTSRSTVIVAARPNSEPTGLPAITGTPQVGQALTADTSAIDDEDGMENAVFRYQWFASKSGVILVLLGETSSTYTLAPTDEGYTFQVQVSFTDDADNQESLTSEATVAVAATTASASLTAAFQDLPDSHDGSTAFTFRVLFSEDVGISYVNMRDDAFSLSEGDVTGARRVDGRNDLWEITVEPDDDSDVGITLPANRSCTTTGAICTREDSPRQLTNSPTATVTGPAEAPPTNTSAAGAPTISGTPQVEQTLTADTSSITDEDGLTNVSYSYQWIAGGSDIAGATGSTYTLTSSEEGQTVQVRVTFTDDAGNEETLTSEATGAVAAAAAQANNPPTGLPTIGGTPQVGETLTADTSPIDDEDGLTNVSYSYQWIAGGSDIAGATGSTYTLTASEQGKTVQVRVTFTDDADNEETLTSAATVEVTAAPAPLTASLADSRFQSARHNGADDRPQMIVAFSLPVASFEKTTPSVSLTGATVRSVRRHQEDGLDNAWIFFLDPAGDGDIVLSLVTGRPCDSGGICTEDGEMLSEGVQVILPGPQEEGEPDNPEPDDPNSPATGAPTIGGTPQVEETLTADTSAIDDEDGLTNVSYGYQWTAGGSDIDGATGASFTLTASQQGKTIQVRVTFTDDRGNAETLTSIATAEVAAAPEPLTVRLKLAAPVTHDGSSEFTFEIEFSEEFGLGYATLRDHAFNVTGGSVETAQRTDKPSNISWRITVKPQGNGDVTIELPATTDCGATGAICTGDGRKLSNSLSFTVSGPGQ